MKFDKPDFETTLAAAPETGFAGISAPVPEPLRRSGADYVRKSKVKIHAIDSAVSGISEITGTVQCAFGIVHHPTLSILRQGNQVLVERYHCGCREGTRGHFCVHSAAVLMARYDHADLRLLNRESQLETRLNGIRIRLGTDRKTTEPIYWTPEDPERVSSPNAAVIGGPDTGNTQLVKSMVVQFLRQRARSQTGVLIFDWMGDYDESKTDFIEATGARVRKLQKLPLDPFSLRQLERKPQLQVHRAMAFADTLVRAFGLGPLQKSILVQAVVAAYEAKGITSDPLTWDRTAPGFAEVYEEYTSRPQSQRNDSLSQVMESLTAYELFDSQLPERTTTLELFRGTMVIDMSGYPRELQRFAAGIMLEQLYAQMCGSRRRPTGAVSKMLMIDEADPLLEMGCPGLEGILRRSREYGLGVVLAAGSPVHFCGDRFDWQQVIRTWIVHNAEELYKPELENLLRLDTFEMGGERLYQWVKHQQKLQSLIRVGTEEPMQSEDLPFYEVVRDTRQSYLKESRQEVRTLPLEGMPLLDVANLDTVDALEEIAAAPMAELTEL